MIDLNRGSEVWGREWHPTPRPWADDRGLAFRCYWTVRGDRVFFPEAWDRFQWRAGNIGIAALDAYSRPGADPQSAKLHAVMALLFVKARHTTAYLSNGFNWYADLRVRDTDDRGVLPLNRLGPPKGGTSDWTVRSLAEYGEEILRGRGREISPGAAVAFGLHAALDPRSEPHSTEDRLAAVRAALFTDPAPVFPDGVPDELILDYQDALFGVYHGHTTRSPTEPVDDFLGWAGVGGHDNIRKLVLGRVRRLDRWREDELDAGFEEMCWRSVRYTGAAISQAAHWWLHAAAPCCGQTPREERLFRSMYCCGPTLGGPPLVVLSDRFSFLEAWLEDVLTEPDDLRLPVLYGLLGCYADIARARRAADKSGSVRRNTDLVQDVAAATDDGGVERIEIADELAGAARRIAADRDFNCPCANPMWSCVGAQPADAIRIGCSRCGWQSPLVPLSTVCAIVSPLGAA